MKCSLGMAKWTIDTIDCKINEPWNLEDVWGDIGLEVGYKTRRRCFYGFEKQKMKRSEEVERIQTERK